MCSGKAPRGPAELFSPCQAPVEAQAFQLLILTSVPSKLSQVARCSHPSWEHAQTAALDKTQTAGPGQ